MKILLAFLSAAIMVLSGCALMQSAQLPAAPAFSPIEKAQAAINEANLLITASARVVISNYEAKIMNEAEFDEYGTKLVDFAEKVDTAQAGIRNGELSAIHQADILKSLVIALHREIAAKARGKP